MILHTLRVVKDIGDHPKGTRLDYYDDGHLWYYHPDGTIHEGLSTVDPPLFEKWLQNLSTMYWSTGDPDLEMDEGL